MKLNPDCIRDILLKVEEIQDVHHHWDFTAENIPILFPKYTFEEVIYHLRQCDKNGLLMETSCPQNYSYYIVGDLSPKGHEFLANVRENKIWEGVKSVAGKVGSTSLNALVQIATGVVTELIKSYFITQP